MSIYQYKEKTMKEKDEIVFTQLNEKGKVIKTKILNRSDIVSCPNTIFIADHYRKDGTCRCDDKDHLLMAKWGYVWNDESIEWE